MNKEISVFSVSSYLSVHQFCDDPEGNYSAETVQVANNSLLQI